MKTKTIITFTLALLLQGVANVPWTAAQLAPKQSENPTEAPRIV